MKIRLTRKRRKANKFSWEEPGDVRVTKLPDAIRLKRLNKGKDKA